MRKIETPARAWLVAAAGVFALGAIGLARALYPLLTALAGRDATLTGRTAIWAEVWRAILRRPWLGYGFSAFWRGWNGASFDVVVALKFVLFHAHNGFLEVWLELGAAGLLLFLLSYVRGWCRLWPAIRRGDMRTAAWPACVLLLIAAYDLDENTLLSFNGLYWVLYVSALVQIELLAKRALPLRRSPAVRLRAPASALPLLAPTGAAWL
jgi:O-antigen ligase